MVRGQRPPTRGKRSCLGTIYIYSGPVDEEIKRGNYAYRDLKGVLTVKLITISELFRPFALFVNETEVQAVINNADASSFAIVEEGRKLLPGIARYTPIEIFGLVDPPHVSPYNILYVNGSVDRIVYFRKQFDRIVKRIIESFHPIRKRRIADFEKKRQQYPFNPIVVVWSPTYRYPPGTRPIDIYTYPKFDRPDQDNYPNARYYTWGF